MYTERKRCPLLTITLEYMRTPVFRVHLSPMLLTLLEEHLVQASQRVF